MAFEIVGMLGRTIHIPNSCFRAVPNPTFYHWDKKYFSMRKLLREYKNKITDDDLIRIDSAHIGALQAMAETVDERLSSQKAKSGESGICLKLLDALHGALDQCDKYLKTMVRRKVIELVLREHVQEVLKMVNNEDGYEDGGEATDGENISTDDPNKGRKLLRYNDLMTASPEEKQEKLMDLYFAVLLPRVVAQATQALRRVKVTTLTIPQLAGHNRQSSNSSLVSLVTPISGSSPTIQIQSDEEPEGRTSQLRQEINVTEKQATEVWCTLVLRMLCWLLLHDFHNKDVQKAKSELLGSRLPVYIA